MYFTRIITITAVASVAVATCGLAASTLPFDYTPSHGAHQQLVRREATVSISASGSHIQHLDRRSPAKGAKKGAKKGTKKGNKKGNKKGEPTAAPGGELAAAPGGKPAAAPGDEPAAAPGGEPAAAPGGEPAAM